MTIHDHSALKNDSNAIQIIQFFMNSEKQRTCYLATLPCFFFFFLNKAKFLKILAGPTSVLNRL